MHNAYCSHLTYAVHANTDPPTDLIGESMRLYYKADYATHCAATSIERCTSSWVSFPPYTWSSC